MKFKEATEYLNEKLSGKEASLVRKTVVIIMKDLVKSFNKQFKAGIDEYSIKKSPNNAIMVNIDVETKDELNKNLIKKIEDFILDSFYDNKSLEKYQISSDVTVPDRKGNKLILLSMYITG